MKIDWNKEIKLNIPWNDNFLKTSPSINIMSMLGYIISGLFVYTFWDIVYFSKITGGGMGLVIVWMMGSNLLIILNAILMISFYIEILKKHRLKNKFLTNNSIYSIIFYAGLILNLLIVGCYILVILTTKYSAMSTPPPSFLINEL